MFDATLLVEFEAGLIFKTCSNFVRNRSKIKGNKQVQKDLTYLYMKFYVKKPKDGAKAQLQTLGNK